MVKENNFTWIKFYMEFADKLLEYQNNRKELISKIIETFDNINMDLPKLEESEIIDIDPFTVFSLFTRKLSIENNIILLNEIKKNIFYKKRSTTRF